MSGKHEQTIKTNIHQMDNLTHLNGSTCVTISVRGASVKHELK